MDILQQQSVSMEILGPLRLADPLRSDLSLSNGRVQVAHWECIDSLEALKGEPAYETQ